MFTPNSQTPSQLDGSALKVGIVQARFNPEITNALAKACLAELKAMGVKHIGIVTGSGVFTLEPLNNGARTLFKWEEELVFPWFLGGPIGAFIGGKIVLRQIWKRNLRGLAVLCKK